MGTTRRVKSSNSEEYQKSPSEGDRGTSELKPCGLRSNLLSQKDLPQFLQDNEFLLDCHRPQLNSFQECFKSIFRLHSETVNIWTHLIGAIYFICLTLYHLTRPSGEIPWQQKASFSVFLAGAILCLSLSTLFHAVACHSPDVSKLFAKLDYCGVITLIVSSFVPWLHFSFFCHERMRMIYLIGIIILGVICIATVLDNRFGQREYRPLRAGLFSVLGLSGSIPALHYFALDGFFESFGYVYTWLLILMAVLYLSGGFIYSIRVPERVFPGCCDIWGQSHQIMHICVIGGALCCYHGAILLAEDRLSNPICPAI